MKNKMLYSQNSHDDAPARHSDDIQDIVTSVPSWLEQWGISLFGAILVFILGVTALISYPDLIKTQLIINTPNPAVPVKLNHSCRLVSLKVNQNQSVRQGQVLMQVEDHDGSRYDVLAPVAGSVAFAGIIQQNQELSNTQPLLFITPKAQQFFGEMSIQQEQLGKVTEGQQVLIKVNAFPAEDYGILKGKITFISTIPNNGKSFIARVDFTRPDSNKINQVMTLKPGMLAQAEIITKNETVFRRLVKGFRIFDRH